MNINMKIILCALYCFALNSCIFSEESNYRVRKEAQTIEYNLYISDKKKRERVDSDWIHSNRNLGFGFLPHPYGDEALKGYGVDKKINHKYSEY